jgi:hypothetical protein
MVVQVWVVGKRPGGLCRPTTAGLLLDLPDAAHRALSGLRVLVSFEDCRMRRIAPYPA